MELLPEWAPGLHPMLVHFPIALLCTAALLDAVSLLFRSRTSLHTAATFVYALGALGALASYLTGRQAADSVLLSGAANTVLTDHADWATVAVWFYGFYAVIRIGSYWWDRARERRWLHVLFFSSWHRRTVSGSGNGYPWGHSSFFSMAWA